MVSTFDHVSPPSSLTVWDIGVEMLLGRLSVTGCQSQVPLLGVLQRLELGPEFKARPPRLKGEHVRAVDPLSTAFLLTYRPSSSRRALAPLSVSG